MRDDFAVFILTHGRADNVMTYKTLRDGGYTGPIWLLVDDEDAQIDQYRERYGDQVIIFDKRAIAAAYDEGDNFHDRRSVFYARNACFEVAALMGLRSFLQLDDDYRVFFHNFRADLTYRQRRTHRLDDVFAIVLEYMESTPAITTIALGQTGDIIGGEISTTVEKVWMKRKAMNSFFCMVERRFAFVGRINEDVNTYVLLGHRGGLFLTVYNTVLQQRQTQHSAGGMTELYQDSGTYVKSFYTVMYAPSCTRIGIIEGNVNPRWHHRIRWDHAVPCILREQYRKS